MIPVVGTFTCCMHTPIRKAVKQKYGIMTGENDRMLAWCCDTCILCQGVRRTLED